MLTTFGRFVRKLRIDKGYLLKDMADYLNVSASFLSAVEMGKKKIPSDWNAKVTSYFQLDSFACLELQKAIHHSQEELELNLKNSSQQQRELAFVFARKLDSLDEDKIREIFGALGNTEED